MKIDHRDIVEGISRIAYAQHMLEGYKYGTHGKYTLGDVVRYWRSAPDIFWQIECIPAEPRRLSELLDRADEIEKELTDLIATHVHTEARGQFGECTECGEWLPKE